MSVDKLRTWLKLPAGAWPPTHYALIGLRDGTGSPEEIEGRVLERLELLRNYQLQHPDEATDGMNLLARALDCLTNPELRRAYDQSLGLTPARDVEAAAPAVDDLLQTLLAVPVLHASSDPAENVLPDTINLPDLEDDLDDLEFDDEPEILVELVDDAAPTEPPPLPEAILLPEALLLPEVKPTRQPPPLPTSEPKIQVHTRKPSGRPRSRARELYADLARIRKVLRLWDRARPFVSDLDRTISRRTDSVALLGWLAELRPLLPTIDDLIGRPNQPGNLVAVLARQPLVVDMFRTLLPSQREALAKDFRAAHFCLAEEYEALRRRVRQRTEKDWVRAIWNPTLKHLAEYPEWFFLFLGLLIFMVAAVRSL